MRRKAKEKAKLKLGQEQRVQFASDRPNSVVESNETSGSVWARFQCLLSAPVSGKSLAVLRICFGAIMFLEAVSLVRPSAMTMGHTPLENYYAGPGIRFNFPFEGFEWLPFLSVQGFRVMVGILGFAGLMVAFGVFYRISAAILFLTWGYFFSVESTRTYWQSYYYLEMLLTFLMIWLPAAQNYSFDAWRNRRSESPKTIPFWPLLLLRGQLFITYFYAGVAKINADWLLDAAPLRWALREPHVAGKLKPWFSPTHFDWIQTVIHHVGTAYFLSYAGLLFDLSIGVLFLIRRTRFLAFVLMALFHATNHFVIYDNIDWFPLLGITSALIFLNPDWPEKFRAWLHSPRWAQPDWPWFGTGFIVIPVFGAALGWKSRAAFSSLKCDLRPSIHSYTPFLVAAWLVWQGLFPLRHYFIAGDARITGEGLSFSWRLKTDDHFAQAAQIYVQDAAIVPRDWKPGSRINWNEFGEEKVIYSKITPGRINWKQLPEIVVTIEPMMGERIFFNPFSVSSAAITERDARDRVRQIWHEAYGREPRFIGATAPVAPVIDSLSDALRQGGAVAEAAQMTLFSSRAKQYNSPLADPQSERRNRGNVFAALRNLCARDSSGAIIPILRRLNPFALQGENQVSLPFLLIEDPALFYTAPEERFRLNQALWKTPLRNGPGSGPPEAMSAEQPRIIYTADVGNEINSLYPQACVFDALERPEMPPQIRWNSLKDCSPSKFDHISNQPFYLRRYARRIASLWEHKYGRRPIVTAETSVSINHRPYQPIVNPDADLAAVSQKWFRHNDWIRDLETPRIPRDALAATRR